jgi:hypothetical protein
VDASVDPTAARGTGAFGMHSDQSPWAACAGNDVDRPGERHPGETRHDVGPRNIARGITATELRVVRPHRWGG